MILDVHAVGFDLRAVWEQIPLWLRVLVPLLVILFAAVLMRRRRS